MIRYCGKSVFAASLSIATLATLAFAQASEESGYDPNIPFPGEKKAPKHSSDSLAKKRPSIADMLDNPYPMRRLVYNDDIVINFKTIKLESNEKATLVYAYPRKPKKVPAVFIIDIQTIFLANFNSRRLARQRTDQRKARYLHYSPFGSNLLGQGFCVAYLLTEDLDSMRSARTVDWLEAFERVSKMKAVDENSFFLMSTKEYANTALYLAAHYPFSGVILEEPTYMLFSRQSYQDIIDRSDRLTKEEIWEKTDPKKEATYSRIFGNINSSLLLVRSQDAPSWAFNDKTLIPKLIEGDNFLEALHLNKPARSIINIDRSSGVMARASPVQYYEPSVSTWIAGMISYLKENSMTSTEALPIPDPKELRERRRQRRGGFGGGGGFGRSSGLGGERGLGR